MVISWSYCRQQGQLDKLPAEIEYLQKLEAIAANQWKRARRKQQPQNPFGNITRFFSPFSKPTETKTRHKRTGSLLVHSNTNDNLGQVKSAMDRLEEPSATSLTVQRGHRRTKSDIHDIATTLALSGSDNSRPSSRPSSQLSAHEEMVEDDESSSTPMNPSPSPTLSRSPTPSLDFEISIAVEVESGKIHFYNQLYEDDNQRLAVYIILLEQSWFVPQHNFTLSNC